MLEQRQSYYETGAEILRERVARSNNSAHVIARKEVQEPWFLLAFFSPFFRY